MDGPCHNVTAVGDFNSSLETLPTDARCSVGRTCDGVWTALTGIEPRRPTQ
jgi:hypothetical protein